MIYTPILVDREDYVKAQFSRIKILMLKKFYSKPAKTECRGLDIISQSIDSDRFEAIICRQKPEEIEQLKF